MRQYINAKFDTLDAAEAAATAVKRALGDAGIVFLRPESPHSLRLTRKLRHFTLIPTAVTSMNYYTILQDNDFNYRKLNEIERRQTSDLRLVCDSSSLPRAESLIIAKGGTITRQGYR